MKSYTVWTPPPILKSLKIRLLFLPLGQGTPYMYVPLFFIERFIKSWHLPGFRIIRFIVVSYIANCIKTNIYLFKINTRSSRER